MSRAPRGFALALTAASVVFAQARLYPPPSNWTNPRDGLRLAERGERGMVVSGDETATRVGLSVLKSGGNAVDAAVAVAFALAVTMPEAGNLGGGGMLLVRLQNGTCKAIDFREMLPSAARPEQYASEFDRYIGIRSVGVPGTLAGLGTAHSQLGSKAWAELLEPARKLAAEGVEVSRRTSETIAELSVRMRDFPEASRIYLNSAGAPPAQGALLKQPDLARSIARLQRHGWREFYRGEMSREIVADLRKLGSFVTREDWQSYEALEVAPLRGSYRGLPVVTMPPATSGGVALVGMLNILERYELRREDVGSAATWHLMIEAMKRADFDRRRWYGDRGLAPATPNAVIEKSHAARLAAAIRTDRTTPSAALPAEPAKTEQTSHFAVADSQGNLALITYTLQGPMGSFIVPKGTGILLSGAAAYFDAGSGNANEIGPRKRAIFSMAPTIVMRSNGTPWLALGLSGGARIPNVLLQLIVNVVDHRMGLRDAVDAPRISQNYLPDQVLAEPGAFSPETERALASLGHKIVRRSSPMGDVHAILIDESGVRFGWPDGRFGGRAMGY